MIDDKPRIIGALLANAPLMALLGAGDKITQLIATSADLFPRITVFELDNTDSDYADDTAILTEINIQVSIWNKIKDPAAYKSPSTIAIEVDKTMKALGYKRTSTVDLYEDGTGVWHKPVRYSSKQIL